MTVLYVVKEEDTSKPKLPPQAVVDEEEKKARKGAPRISEIKEEGEILGEHPEVRVVEAESEPSDEDEMPALEPIGTNK
jgi:hypothetical protein